MALAPLTHCLEAHAQLAGQAAIRNAVPDKDFGQRRNVVASHINGNILFVGGQVNRKMRPLCGTLADVPMRSRYVRERLLAAEKRYPTQRALAEALGVDKSRLNRWLQGTEEPNPKLETLERLADALGEPIGALVGDDDVVLHPPPPPPSNLSDRELRSLGRCVAVVSRVLADIQRRRGGG